MLRLMIVDDERIIRETIRSLIDWNGMGINLVATCKNGLEAYDAILDEYPDIVLTDIKMPGLSGLELIERLQAAGGQTEFIILSGYGEFHYAAQAMKLGVKHFLLKPCNEAQIIEAVQETASRCRARRNVSKQDMLPAAALNQLHQDMVRSLVIEGIHEQTDVMTRIRPYQDTLDFEGTAYVLHYVYFLEQSNLAGIIASIQQFVEAQGLSMHYWAFYVNQTLLLFFEENAAAAPRFLQYLKALHCSQQSVSLTHSTQHFTALSALITLLSQKLRRFPVIYSIGRQGHIIEICNYSTLFQQTAIYAARLSGCNDAVSLAHTFEGFLHLIDEVSDAELLTSLIASLLVRQTQEARLSEIAEFLGALAEQSSCEDKKVLLKKQFPLLFAKHGAQIARKDFVERTLQYIEAHLQDPNLSLKWIAENVLFMNVDYLSKQFLLQTGKKFSAYLNEARIHQAKQLLLHSEDKPMYMIAESVGCGNNPQYFSQWFKKHTGVTPTAFIRAR